MMYPSWLRRVHSRMFASRVALPARRLPVRHRLRLEELEERITPTTYNVTPDGTGTSSLAGAIAQVNADSTADTIVLAQGQYNLTGELTVTTTHGLTIEGSGSSAGATVIDASGAGNRAFFLNDAGGNVTFQDLTIQGGKASDSGGLSTSAIAGGGILDIGGNVALSTVVLQSNLAQGTASAAQAMGGGIFVSNGSLTINNSIIQNNQAIAGTGGTALAGGVSDEVSSGSTFQFNLSNSTVVDNTAQGGDGTTGGAAEAGGVLIGGVNATISASTLIGNNAIGGNATSGTAGIASGGGLVDIGTSTFQLSISGSTVADNTAQGGNGTGNAGIASGGGIFADGVSTTLTNSTIANNMATGGTGSSSSAVGAGLILTDGTNPVTDTLTNVTVAYNQATAGASGTTSGGGIGWSSTQAGSSLTLTNTLVALNSASIAADVSGSVTSGGNNLIGNADGSSGFSAANGDLLGTTANPLNPQLGQLANNGGPTLTIALLSGSPAIDNGNNAALSVTGSYDQRGAGFNRIVNGTMDIGAFEFVPPSPPASPPASPPSGGGNSSSPPPATTTAPSPSLFTAVVSLYIDGAMLELDTLNHQPTASVQASIDYYLPYAGPFGSLIELAGRLAVLNAYS